MSAELSLAQIEHLRIVPDRLVLLQFLRKHAVVAELGVDAGDYSASILDCTAPRELHLIDVWNCARYDEAKCLAVHQRFKAHGSVTIHRRRSEDALASFPDCYFDWVYLDTTHKYADTTRELALCRIKVKPDGIIAGHDYTIGNIDRGVRYGVIDAVNEFCITYDWELLYLTNESHRCLSFALSCKTSTTVADLRSARATDRLILDQLPLAGSDGRANVHTRHIQGRWRSASRRMRGR